MAEQFLTFENKIEKSLSVGIFCGMRYKKDMSGRHGSKVVTKKRYT